MKTRIFINVTIAMLIAVAFTSCTNSDNPTNDTDTSALTGISFRNHFF